METGAARRNDGMEGCRAETRLNRLVGEAGTENNLERRDGAAARNCWEGAANAIARAVVYPR